MADPMTIKILAFTLITVTYGGEVHHSRGYETLRMCEEAKSIARTGMTIEANELWVEAMLTEARKRGEITIVWGEITGPSDIKNAECVPELPDKDDLDPLSGAAADVLRRDIRKHGTTP